MNTMPISQPPLLDFEDLHGTASLASLMEARLSESDKGQGCGRQASH